MNKIDFIFFELLNALQIAKGIIKGHSSVNNVEKLHFPRLFSRKKGKQKKKKVLSNPNKIPNPFRDVGKGKKVNDLRQETKGQIGIRGDEQMTGARVHHLAVQN